MNSTDELFSGELIEGVPNIDAEYARKMPGDADGLNKGDHCSI
jgi:hypothetical protein